MKNTPLTAVLFALFLFVSLSQAATASENEQEKFAVENAGALTGRVVLPDGSPFPYGFVSFFTKESEIGEHQDFGISKRAPMMVAFIREDGRFATQLFPSGLYYMGAVMQKGWVGGPPRDEQKRYSAIGKRGEYLLFEVKAAAITDIGTVAVRKPDVFPSRETKFTVEGRVIDDQGKGVAGSVVVAKIDINDPKGTFISAETDEEGKYQLIISPGRYFFVARKTLTRAGRPKPGGLMGTLGQDKPIGIAGKSDEPPAYIIGKAGEVFKNVDIIMFKVPIPEVRRQEIEARVKAKEIDKGSLPADLPLMKQKSENAEPSKHKPER